MENKTSKRKGVIAAVVALAVIAAAAIAYFAIPKGGVEQAVAAPTTRAYIAQNAPVAIADDDLTPSGKYLHVKYTLAFKDKVDEGETIDSMYASEESAMEKLISQVDGVAPLYEIEGNENYYVAFTDSTRLNELNANVLDVAFAWDDLNGHSVDGITYNDETGIALVPKSVIEDAGDTGITQQILLAVDFDNLESSTNVTIEGGRTGVEIPQTTLKAKGDAFSFEIGVPVATAATAGQLTLEDMGVELNDAPVALVDGKNAIYDPTTGILHLGYSPLALSEVKITISSDGPFAPERAYADHWLDWTTMHVYNNGNTYFDQLDLDSLNRGDLLVYNGWTRMYGYHEDGIPSGDQGYSSDGMSSDETPANIIITSNVNGWNYTGEDNHWKSVNTTWGEITFAAASPFGKTATKWGTSQTYSLHAVNGDSEIIAMTCAHVESPLGMDDAYIEGTYPIGMRILEKTDNALVVGYISYELGYQTGIGVYKYAVQSKGGIELIKSSANPSATDNNGCYTLEGAVYGVYSSEADAERDANRVKTLTTDADGRATTDKSLSAGTYYVRELTAPTGYLVDGETHPVTVSSGQMVPLELLDQPANDPERMRVGKIDKETTQNLPENSASFENAEFTFTYYAGYYTEEEINAGKPAQDGVETRTWVMRTKDSGIASPLDGDDYKASGDSFFKTASGNVVVPLGTITSIETKAPEGYLIGTPKLYVSQIVRDDTVAWGARVKPINYDESIVPTEYNTPVVPEQVKKGKIRFYKTDSQTTDHKAQGEGVLAGAVYNVVNNGENAVKSPIDGQMKENGAVVATYTTDEAGFFITDDLPVGDYIIREQTASTGYRVNVDDVEVTLPTDGEDGQIVTSGATEDIKRGSLVIGKIDRENNSYEPEGAATLEGARFSITNDSANPVVVNGSEYAPGEVVGYIDTVYEDGKYVARCAAEALPYGDYIIRETKTSDGYVLDAYAKAWTKHVSIREDLVELDYTAIDDAMPNAVARADMELSKVDANTMRRMPKVAFLVTSKSTGEAHVLVTDANGIIDTSWNAHDVKTNLNDEALVAVPGASPDAPAWERYSVDDTKLDSGAGVWFHGNTDRPASIDNERGALPFDEYLVEELLSTANAGHAPVSFDLTVMDTRYNNRVIDMGTVDNAPAPSIGTTLADSNGAHSISATANLPLTDTIAYRNFEDGDYIAKGSLYVLEEDGTLAPDAMPIATAEKGFSVTAGSRSGTVAVDFNIDATELAGKKIVAIEFVTDTDGNPVADHYDLADAAQIVEVCQIATSLADENGSKEIPSTGNVTLIDTVTYTGLDTDKYYTLTGVLHERDAEGNDLGVAHDASGNAITATLEFCPEAANGTVDMTFNFTPASGGMTAVAFETLSYNARNYAVHADIADAAQTIKVVGIGTTAADSLTGQQVAHLGAIDISDTVAYANLTVGSEYKLVATVHERLDPQTAETADLDGGEIEGATGTLTFTAEEENGFVVVPISGDITPTVNTTMVVYERLYAVTDEGDVLLAVHENIDDGNQYVRMPNIGTVATDELSGTHTVKNDGSAVIADTVAYNNLQPDVTYMITGSLYVVEQTDAGWVEVGPLKDAAGNPVTSSVTFTAEDTWGVETVRFPLAGADVAEKTIVVYEDLECNGVVVARHADANDTDQQVHGASAIATTAVSKATGTHVLELGEKAVIVDTVEYGNLVVGERYIMNGTLHVRGADGSDMGAYVPSDGSTATATKIFTPSESYGTVTMNFIVDTTSLKDTTFVAFEELTTDEGAHVAGHADISDNEQAVHQPSIGTNAVDKGNKKHEAAAEDKATIVDTVSYKGLNPGSKYRVEGKLYDKKTGREYVAGGKNITASKTFTAEKADGSVEVEFSISNTVMAGSEIVVYERLYAADDGVEDNVLLAVHEDLKDENQLVKYHEPGLGDAVANAFDKTGEFLMKYWFLFALAGVVIAVRGISLLVEKDPTWADEKPED